MPRIDSASRRRAAWTALLLVALAAAAIVLIPVWVVAPFRPQSEGGLEASYLLRSWAPLLTAVAAAAVLLLAIALWRGAGGWRQRAALLVICGLTLAAAWFARQNHFEWMFNPLPEAAYASIADADFVADTDMVLAVDLGGEAIAYPVRQLAYHHLVQDVIGGTPIVATY